MAYCAYFWRYSHFLSLTPHIMKFEKIWIWLIIDLKDWISKIEDGPDVIEITKTINAAKERVIIICNNA